MAAGFQGIDVQLNCIGPQDEFIRSTECSSKETLLAPFRRFEYLRTTRHACEEIELGFATGFRFGQLNTLSIPRSGDMLGNITLQIQLPVIPGALPEDMWCDSIGYVLLKRVRFKIDDVIISDSERLWYDLHDALFLAPEVVDGINEMIGKGRNLPLTRSHTLHVPLKLFSGKSHHVRQNFLPLLASPGTTLTLDIDTEKFMNCVTSFGGTESQSPLDLDVIALSQFIFLDDFERERLINRQRDILIEIEQDVEALSYVLTGDAKTPLDTVSLDLSEVDFPVKALVWVAYDSTALSTKRYFQYADSIESSVLILDGNERYNISDDGTTNLVETYYRGKNCVKDNVHVYSFSLDYSSWQPAGQLSFSEIRMPVLKVKLKQKNPNLIIKCFILGYRFLRFDKGRVQVLFQ